MVGVIFGAFCPLGIQLFLKIHPTISIPTKLRHTFPVFATHFLCLPLHNSHSAVLGITPPPSFDSSPFRGGVAVQQRPLLPVLAIINQTEILQIFLDKKTINYETIKKKL